MRTTKNAVLALTVVVLAAALSGCAARRGAPAPQMEGNQLTFATPGQAVTALQTAVKADDKAELQKIFGPDVQELLSSGDPVADANAKKRVAAALQDAAEIAPLTDPDAPGGPQAVVLIVGNQHWPFPIPLVQSGGRWRFDTAAGKEEVLNRRIGSNEVEVLELCGEYVDAQLEYADLQAKSGAAAYAPKFFSTPGKRDGLFWEPAPGEPLSPMGPLVAQAASEGYRPQATGDPIPFHGYYFRILTRQGRNARFGAMNYMVNGKMTKGFALLAYPAAWGNSGIMTFMTGPDGVVYQKSLGPQTPEAAAKIAQFDPDESWSPVE